MMSRESIIARSPTAIRHPLRYIDTSRVVGGTNIRQESPCDISRDVKSLETTKRLVRRNIQAIIVSKRIDNLLLLHFTYSIFDFFIY